MTQVHRKSTVLYLEQLVGRLFSLEYPELELRPPSLTGFVGGFCAIFLADVDFY